MEINAKTKENIASIPNTPGVYIFIGKNNKKLYVGKASSLRSRVRSYFTANIARTRSVLIAKMVTDAIKIEWTELPSVLEALICEANLIKKYQPKYNIKEKDNKSWNYILITKEKFPRIMVVRGYDLGQILDPGKIYQKVFGPYTNGSLLRQALMIIRKIFPYRDKCLPFEVSGKNKKCFDAQINLCPGLCHVEGLEKEYKKTIKNIILFLQGQKKELISSLVKEMNANANKGKYEKALIIKRRLYSIQHIQDVSLLKKSFLDGDPSSQDIRIEAYDISHTSGTNTVGVMTVIKDGVANKSEYRRFNIRGKGGVVSINDTQNLKELLTRRLQHTEWALPQILVVDGSSAQINIARSLISKNNLDIDVVGVVKDTRHRPSRILGDRFIISKYHDQILLANSESHRFAIAYHRNKRDKKIG